MTPNPVDPKFLAIFNADPVVAEKAYHDLYKRLRRFFEWKGCMAPDDLAQEALKRGFVRIAEGQSVYSEDPASYFMGFARHVLSEWWKRRKEEQFDPDNPVEPGSGHPEESINEGILLARVLDSLSVEDREFLIAYTFEDKTELARRKGESINTLRIRAFRLRDALREKFERNLPKGKNRNV